MRMNRKLSAEEINDILDQFIDWFNHPNVVEMDIRQEEHKDGDYTVSLHIGELDNASNVTARLGEAFEIPLNVDIIWNDPRDKVANGEDANISTRSLPVLKVQRTEIHEGTTLDADNLVELQAKQRPCPGGYLIHAEGLNSGSIALSMMYKGTYRLLSNNHVISKNGNVGKKTYQPTEVKPTNELVRVSGFTPIVYYSDPTQPNPTLNVEDVAWCNSDSRTSSQKVRTVSVPGRRSPIVGETVNVFGGVTRVWKQATISSITFRYKSQSSTLGYSWWKDGIELDALITQPGDSGSAYIAETDNMLVGLHRAGGTRSYGCPLD